MNLLPEIIIKSPEKRTCMRQQEHFINSVNLNAQTEFPFLMLKVENGTSYPMNPGFRVMHWHEDLQFIYVLEGSVCVKTLDREEIISSGEGALAVSR